jgi:predicted RNase H-like nuclease (RuvC/YqgF family)
MSTATEERVTNLSLQRQITEFSTRLDQVARDVTEIKQMLRAVEERVRALENHEAGSHPLMESRIDAAWRKIEEHDRRMKSMEDMVVRLDHSNRLMAWLGGILGSTVLVWLATQILQILR